ncbi:TPA: type I toxin-antitoxin system Ibs family toxin, partial [Escherichia coli]
MMRLVIILIVLLLISLPA